MAFEEMGASAALGSHKFSSKKRFINILARNMLATTVYFIWTERNGRIFQNRHKAAGLLSQEIISQVRLLLTVHKFPIPKAIRARWNI